MFIIGSVTMGREKEKEKASNFKPQAVCLLYSTFQLSPESFSFFSFFSSTRPLVCIYCTLAYLLLMAYVNNKDTWEILMAFSPGKSIL